jgi:hypothetical protein
MSDELKLHGLVAKEGRDFTPSGEVKEYVVYSYMLGPHGPFTLRFEKGLDRHELVTGAIEDQRSKLRAILGLTGEVNR